MAPPSASKNDPTGDGIPPDNKRVGAMPMQVSDQITDGVAITNVSTLGLGPSYAALQSMLGQAQAQNILLANMVSSQKQNAIMGMTTMTQSIQQLMQRNNR
ncbi:RebB family R body protein [Thalassospira sp. MA62]|nr:RebB family R body protein [Thalassospira sp. MA62]